MLRARMHFSKILLPLISSLTLTFVIRNMQGDSPVTRDMAGLLIFIDFANSKEIAMSRV